MQPEAVYGVLIPFLGTSLGAACVFFLRQYRINATIRIIQQVPSKNCG